MTLKNVDKKIPTKTIYASDTTTIIFSGKWLGFPRRNILNIVVLKRMRDQYLHYTYLNIGWELTELLPIQQSNRNVFKLSYRKHEIHCFHSFFICLIVGSVRSAGCHNVCSFVCGAQVCLEHWIFNRYTQYRYFSSPGCNNGIHALTLDTLDMIR